MLLVYHAQDVKEVVLEEGWLSSGQADGLVLSDLHEGKDSLGVFSQSLVVRLRRLRAHQAMAVAHLGQEKRVHAGLSLPNNRYRALRTHQNAVALLQLLHEPSRHLDVGDGGLR